MPQLAIKSRYLAQIRAGTKTTTIRLACRVKPDDALTFTDYRSSARTRCLGVEQVAVSELTHDHALTDGFGSLPELLAALREHYDLAPTARVWVIRFALEKDSDQSALAFV